MNTILKHFNRKSDFLEKLDSGYLKDTNICFIKDSNQIWTHGTFYDGSDTSIIKQLIQDLNDDINRLKEIIGIPKVQYNSENEQLIINL